MESALNSTSMTGKVCLVTGATSGIGKVTATALAAQGAEVIITGRNQQKAKDTVSWIRSETGNGAVQYLLADYADLGQVRELARAFKERTSRLDVLVNNAGTFSNTRRETPYGVETTLLVNHLAPFLLTNLLLETLQNSAPARIVNVSSEGHKQGTMDFDDLGFERGYFGMKAYARSKLANILFTYELSRRLDASQVTANTLHPGHVATDMWKTNFPVIGPALKWVMGFFALSPEQGADNSTYLASSPDVEGLTGEYFLQRESAESSPLSYDEEVAQRLWQVSETFDRTGASIMKESTCIPGFVSVVAIVLGCLDLARGFMHTIVLDSAATNIAGLDLSTSAAGDLLQLMGAFGISNYLTGIMLILIGLKARPLALVMLGIIPAAYLVGMAGIKATSAGYAPSEAAWGGIGPMTVYLAVSAIAFVAGACVTLYRRREAKGET